jgi:hypothetical protein
VTGVLWFGEHITATPATVLAAVACVAVTIVGIALVEAASAICAPAAAGTTPLIPQQARSMRVDARDGAAG